MTIPDPNTIGCRDLAAGLGSAGRAAVFISPGSRNTPLALAFAVSGAFDDINVRDERAAGFAALGWGKATGRPAIVLCTSGSAGTHYFPAVVEADQSSTPMIVITADRPRHLRGTFAPQTMDQTDLFGRHVKAWIDLDITAGELDATGAAAVRIATDGIAGPVHLNVPLAEPLTPGRLPEPRPSMDTPLRPSPTALPQVGSLAEQLRGKKVVVVAGGYHGSTFAGNLARWCESLGAPLIAGPQSSANGPTAINGDLLTDAGVLEREPPDVVLRIGTLPPSKAVTQWLETDSARHILIHRSRLADPLGRNHDSGDDDARETITEFPQDVVRSPAETTVDDVYTERLVSLSTRAEEAAFAVSAGSFPSEPEIARLVTGHVPSESALIVASSMPIRDVETFGVRRDDVVIIGNRGVNGIDGILGTALGCAISGLPATVLCGDISALHDATTLSEISRLNAPVRVVVVNNDGGGIFSFLPQRRSETLPDELFERHWGTPHGLSLGEVATGFGLRSYTIEDAPDFLASLVAPIRPELVEVRTDRSTNVAIHDEVRAAVREALATG